MRPFSFGSINDDELEANAVFTNAESQINDLNIHQIGRADSFKLVEGGGDLRIKKVDSYTSTRTYSDNVGGGLYFRKGSILSDNSGSNNPPFKGQRQLNFDQSSDG